MPGPYMRRHIRDVQQVTSRAVFGFGICAGGVLALLAALFKGMFPFNLELFLGSLFTARIDEGTWWLGLAVYLLLSGLAAFGYAFIFRSAHRSGAGVGVNLAFFHWAISGFFIGLTPVFHPLVTSGETNPGFFMIHEGFAVSVLFFFGHLLYGAIVGQLFDWAAMRAEYPHPIGPRHFAN